MQKKVTTKWNTRANGKNLSTFKSLKLFDDCIVTISLGDGKLNRGKKNSNSQ